MVITQNKIKILVPNKQLILTYTGQQIIRVSHKEYPMDPKESPCF